MDRKPVFVLITAVAVSVVILYVSFPGNGDMVGIESTVSRVIDGDTIELANGDVVRLIGIDAPERGQPYYNDVVAQLQKLEGKTVRLEKDKTNKDRYGRYLRYVFLDEKFVNLEMVRSGLAYVYIVNPDNRYEREFIEAEILARTSGVGIWSRSSYSGCIGLKYIHYNAEGDDTKNLADEYFVLKNECDEDVIASGWSFRNSLGSFGLKDFNFKNGSEVKIVTGDGIGGVSEIFLGLDRPIWRNSGDTMQMKDGSGNLIFEKSYRVS